MATPVCPKCGSVKLKKSHTRRSSERLLKLLGWHAFRCREESCGWRGLIKYRPLDKAVLKEIKKRKKRIGELLVIITIIAIALYFGINNLN